MIDLKDWEAYNRGHRNETLAIYGIGFGCSAIVIALCIDCLVNDSPVLFPLMFSLLVVVVIKWGIEHGTQDAPRTTLGAYLERELDLRHLTFAGYDGYGIPKQDKIPAQWFKDGYEHTGTLRLTETVVTLFEEEIRHDG